VTLLLSSGSVAWKSAQAGLENKSVSLQMDVHGKRKMWIVNQHHHLQIFRHPVPAIDITGVQQYLGVPFSPMKTRAYIADQLFEGLGTSPQYL